MPRDAIDPITYGDAESRFTRTPVAYHGRRLDDQPDVAGYYHRPLPLVRRKGRIDVYLDPGDDPARVRQVQRHEDIHALTYGDPAPDSMFMPDAGSTGRILGAFDAARRSGAPNVELPAYLGAGELDAVSDADRAAFLDEYKRGLSPEKRALLERMQLPRRLDARPMMLPVARRDLMLRPSLSPSPASFGAAR